MARPEVETVKEKLDIVALIGRYVTLAPSGKAYKGRCPFHADSSPSMTVSPEKGLWHCFGCGAGGDAIGFIMRAERLSFGEALARLAEEVGVELSGGGEKQRLLEACAHVEAYFGRQLRARAAAKARAYLLERGLDEATWARWGIGYAPPGWDRLTRDLGGVGRPMLERLGLLVQGEKGIYSRFRDRIMFPLRDPQGRPVAFAGRALEGEPKYLNVPNTELFTKGTLLYGMDVAREPARLRGHMVLVEGYTDVISLHESGIDQAVGSMGTALTEAQARLLARYTDRVVIAFDRDAAGSAASLRGMGILRSAGLAVDVAQLPPGEDPDTLVRDQGADGFRGVIEDARPFHRFFLASLGERYDLQSIEGKERALDEARELWKRIESIPLRHELGQGLARTLDLPEEEVLGVLRGASRARPAEAQDERALDAEDIVVHFLLAGALPEEVIVDLEMGQFSPEYRSIVERWLELWRSGGTPSVGAVSENLDEETSSRVARTVMLDLVFDDERRAMEDAVRRFLYLPRLEEEIRSTLKELSQAEACGDDETMIALTRRYQELCRARLRGGRQREPEAG